MLTFDDGPGPDTEKIISILSSANTSAVFFITCSHVNESEKSVIKKMSDEGNDVALHGYNHKILQSYSEIKTCKEFIENVTGKPIKYFRPPYGFSTPADLFFSKKLNMTIVRWSVFPRDYYAENPKEIIDFVAENLRQNSIICLHDGPANRMNTADALPEIIRLIDEKNKK